MLNFGLKHRPFTPLAQNNFSQKNPKICECCECEYKRFFYHNTNIYQEKIITRHYYSIFQIKMINCDSH